MLTLRPYQQRGVDEIRRLLREKDESGKKKYRSICYQAPTGAGKTVLFSYICQNAAKQGKSCMVLVHRQELMKQASDKLLSLGLPHGLIRAGQIDTADLIQVASVQTLVRRLSSGRYKPPKFLIIDEGHHAVAGSWRKIVDWLPEESRIIGVTATPERLDGQGLGKEHGGIYDVLVLGPSVKELVAEGFLSRSTLYVPDTLVDRDELKRRGHDFDVNAIGEDTRKRITGSAVKHYLQICPGVPAVAFCTSVANAEEVAKAFTEAGIKARSIDGTMSDHERAAILRGLAEGTIQIVTSCELISEGFDLPKIGAAILLRPTQSLSLYLQQVGRALRPYEGKEKAYIIDHVGNVEHGPPDEDRTWTLEGRPRRKSDKERANPSKRCEKCYACFPPSYVVCPECGEQVKRQEREYEQVDGQLIAIDDPSLLKIKAKKEPSEAQIRMKATRSRIVKEAETLKEAMQIAMEAGYKAGWAIPVWQWKLKTMGVRKKPKPEEVAS